MADWATISSMATAGGTLVLAAATFASIKSSQRAARVAERALLAGQRPLLVPSREDDTPERVRFGDGYIVTVSGHGGVSGARRRQPVHGGCSLGVTVLTNGPLSAPPKPA
jgi:hypothetical protein